MRLMKAQRQELTSRYVRALLKHLKQDSHDAVRPAHLLGRRALEAGLDTLILAKVHEEALIKVTGGDHLSAAARTDVIKRAGTFFANTIKPIEDTRRVALETNRRLTEHNQTLKKHTRELAAANQRFEKEIVRRKAVEESLRKGKLHFAQLLEQSRIMEQQLRQFSHRILLAQEAERKEISRELHDQIAQTLTGINIRLAALKQEATTDTKGILRKITSTQRIVEKSVDIVHRFARDLRPTVLDDLGLLPALNAYLKEFTKRTRLPVSITSVAGIERLDEDKRTVIYRIVQAALTNIDQHADATQATISIEKIQADISVEVHDNGKSFDVNRVLFAKRHKRLGVLGMRERVEMVGGTFLIESLSGKGTTIKVTVPLADSRKKSALK